jgi:ABC-type nickel/cobalt efflux system permease component RcnA
MDDLSLLKAAVVLMIPIGLAIGISFFVYAFYYYRSIRGRDVQRQVNRIRIVIGILFAAFVGLFAVIQLFLNE